MPGYIKPPSNQYIYSSSTVDGSRIMTAASDYGFRNKIINGDFSIWQRGTSFNISSNSNTFCADRWQIQSQGGTAVASQQSFSPGTLTGIETPYYLRLVQSAGSANTLIINRLEDARTLAGQTITISYWAKASASTTITARFDQDFGSGGSSRAANGGSSNTITTSWARYSSTFTVASISGKTIGSSSYIEFFLYYPNTAGITVELAAVQIESGLFVTPFEYRPQQVELAMCQRYYFKHPASNNINAPFAVGSRYSATAVSAMVPLPIQMRSAPSLDFTSGTSYFVFVGGNTSDFFDSFIMDVASASFVVVYTATNVSGTQGDVGYISITNGAAYLGFSAEL